MDVCSRAKAQLLTRAHPSKGGDAKPPVLGAISQDSGAAGSFCLRAICPGFYSASRFQHRASRTAVRVVAPTVRLAHSCTTGSGGQPGTIPLANKTGVQAKCINRAT